MLEMKEMKSPQQQHFPTFEWKKKKLEHEGENVNLIDGHELIQFII